MKLDTRVTISSIQCVTQRIGKYLEQLTYRFKLQMLEETESLKNFTGAFRNRKI